MTEEENQNIAPIKDGELLHIANNILSMLESSNQLDDENFLFSDEFYISILSNLLTEQNQEIIIGETPEEKVKSLKKLIKLLSEIIEADLSHINAKKIILDHDKASTKSLLELIEDLIKTLMNANFEEEENKKEESIELKEEKNKSDDNFRKIKERMRLDDDDENEENNDDNESSSYKRKYAELEEGIDNLDVANDNLEEDEIKTEKEDKDKLIDINYDLEYKNNESDSRVMNVSHISEMEKNKIQGSSGKKNENEQKEENTENKANSKNKKKHDDIPDLLIGKIKEDKIKKKNEEEKEYEEDSIKYNNYLEFNSNMGESNLYDEDNYYIPQSVPRAYNKLNLSNPSKESQSSNNNYIKSKKKSNKKKETEKEKSSNTNSNISFHSKKNNNRDEYNDLNISSTNKKIENSSNIKNNSNQLKESKNSKKEIENNENNNEQENIEEDDISKSSEYSNAVVKSSISTSSQKSKKSDKKIQEKNINTNLILFEIPMTDEEIKYLIKKELRKLYGEKAPRYFKKDFLELISQNLKFQRKEIIKYETGKEPDDFFSREFFYKYQKQMQQIIKNCVKELNQENIYKKNVIYNIGNNINFIKKLKDAENKEILNTIENKRKETESRNDENNFNQILMYPSYCYELQKKIYLTQTQNQIELNFAIEKEREKSIEETKKNYDNKIKILYEILKRQRRERNKKKKFGEILDYELKNMKKRKLRQQVEDMLDQIDEQDNKVNLLQNNKGEDLDKILENMA